MVEPKLDGNWYWAVKIDGEVYADGEEGSKDLARHKCQLNLNEWKAQQQ